MSMNYDTTTCGLLSTDLDLVPTDLQGLDHEIHTNGSTLSRWEETLQRRRLTI